MPFDVVGKFWVSLARCHLCHIIENYMYRYLSNEKQRKGIHDELY